MCQQKQLEATKDLDRDMSDLQLLAHAWQSQKAHTSTRTHAFSLTLPFTHLLFPSYVLVHAHARTQTHTHTHTTHLLFPSYVLVHAHARTQTHTHTHTCLQTHHQGICPAAACTARGGATKGTAAEAAARSEAAGGAAPAGKECVSRDFVLAVASWFETQAMLHQHFEVVKRVDST